MKIEKLPSGSFRVRKMSKGKMYTLIFDHKPSAKEVTIALAEKMQDDTPKVKGTFEHYALEYIETRNNVLSPSTSYTYRKLVKALSESFKSMNLYDIGQTEVQKEINEYSVKHAPKSVRSLHGFIATVLGIYRPQLVLKTTLPQKIEKETYLPTDEDIKRILDYSEGTEDHVGFQLGVLSLRRSEICALSMDDLNGNELHVHRNKVWDNKWIIKESPKTDAGNRIVYLPQKLVDEINSQGYFFKYSPNKLNEHLQKCQKNLNIPKFRFHDLRHYFASYASTIMPEADAMALGGWKSDHVFKQVYRESMKDKRKVSADKFNEIFLS